MNNINKGGTAPPPPNKPPSFPHSHNSDKFELPEGNGMDGPMKERPPPMRPPSRPPSLPQRPTSINSSRPPSLPHRPASINSTGEENVADTSNSARLPPPPSKVRNSSSSSIEMNKASSGKKRPEITIVSAKPMSQVGFRAGASTELSPTENQRPKHSADSVIEASKVPPPRPKSITSPTGPAPALPGRPKPPCRPTPLVQEKKEDSLIDFSSDTSSSGLHPVPKPRPKPAPRVHHQETSSSPTSDSNHTLPSPMRPTRPTIIRSKPTDSTEESIEQVDDENKVPKLPSYIQTSASSDASVNELKAAFLKRQSAFESATSKPKPLPKPSKTEVTDSSNVTKTPEKSLYPSLQDEGNINTTPTPPSRRKRPTIIRPGAGNQDNAAHNDLVNSSSENTVGRADHVTDSAPKPHPLPHSPKPEMLVSTNTPPVISPGSTSKPIPPKPAARKTTPPGPPKSSSAHELKSADLTLPSGETDGLSVTPPPRKKKTGPPRPTQRPLSGSLSQSSVDKLESPKDSAPVRPPSLTAKAPGRSEPASRRVIIHKAFPQSQAPKLPARPGPGHPLFHYMMDCPYGIAIATNDYQSLQTDELSFNYGDLIVLLKQVDDSWYYGKNGGIEGIFPGNYVKVVEPLSAQGVPGIQPASLGAEGGWRRHDESPALLDLSSDTCDTGHGPRCRARFDFEGEGKEDLTFEDGDIIELVEHVANDWLKGRLNGRTGIFPATFVEIIEDLPPTPAADSSTSFDDFHHHDNIATALYDFQGLDGELRFKTGDKITVLSVVNSDWLFGETNGMSGQFPSAFINPIPANLPVHVSPVSEAPVSVSPCMDVPHDIMQTDSPDKGKRSRDFPDQVTRDSPDKGFRDSPDKGSRDSPDKGSRDFPDKGSRDFPDNLSDKGSRDSPDKGSRDDLLLVDSPDEEAYCIAIHEFSSNSPEDLSFHEADKIILLEWVNEEWMKGKLESSGKVGIFPADFVQVIKGLKAPPLKANQAAIEKRIKVKALYDFIGDGENELSFKEGEIIEMLGELSGEEQWREGRVKDKTGLFPISYVQEISS